MTNTPPLTHLDLFSGIGGFALAAEWCGLEAIGFCEIDPWCRRVLGKHWPEAPIHDDVRGLSAGTIRDWLGGRELHLLTGGYPCQPFSLAGQRKGEHDERHLWPEIARILGDIRPRWCLFENVAGHISMGLDVVLDELESLGYQGGAAVIPACAVNAPHRRDRVWILAHTDRAGWQKQRGALTDGPQHAATQCPRGDVPDAESRGIRCGQPRQELGGRGAHLGAEYERQAQCGMGEPDDGLPGWVARPRGVAHLDPRWLGNPLGAFGADWEDGVPRLTEGERHRTHKLKALGNAIVPQVAYVVLSAMLASELEAIDEVAA